MKNGNHEKPIPQILAKNRPQSNRKRK